MVTSVANATYIEPWNRQAWFSAVMILLLLLGLYYPTTIDQHLTILSLVGYLACLLLLTALALWQPNRPSALTVMAVLSIVPLLVLCTAFSRLPTDRFGALPAYGLISILFLAYLRNLRLPGEFAWVWRITNIINLAAGIAIIAGVKPVDDFIVAHYSLSYDDLLPTMLLLRKPVVTFASHSLAAFFWYLFFWINLEAFKVQRKKLFLLFSVGYLLLTLFLLSVSAVVLGGVGICQLLMLAWSSVRRKFLAGAILSVALIPAVISMPAIHWKDAADVVKEILQNPGNGLLGRFTPGGTMYEDLEFLRDHPFSPVGVSFKEGLMFGDSGPVEYILRGSLPLLVLMYGGLYYFLRRNLLSRKHVVFLFFAILAFEIGMTTLTYFRMLLLLPVFIVFLNNLQPKASDPQSSISAVAVN